MARSTTMTPFLTASKREIPSLLFFAILLAVTFLV